MDRKDIAKKIREAIFNRIEEDRAIHASSIEQEVEKVLGAMSIGHYPGRGASVPIPDMYTLTLSEPPACTHTISSTGGVLKKPEVPVMLDKSLAELLHDWYLRQRINKEPNTETPPLGGNGGAIPS